MVFVLTLANRKPLIRLLCGRSMRRGKNSTGDQGSSPEDNLESFKIATHGIIRYVKLAPRTAFHVAFPLRHTARREHCLLLGVRGCGGPWAHTKLMVGNKSNSKPSRFHDQPFLKSMNHRREIVTDVFREEGSRSGLVGLDISHGR